MIFALANCFSEPIRSYHRTIVNEIQSEFPNLTMTRRQNIPSHFTLKYHFEIQDITVIEQMLGRFVTSRVRAPIEVASFDHFNFQTIFARVELSREARLVFNSLMSELRQYPWMQWSSFDDDNLLFHVTVAEQCGTFGNEVMRFLSGREQCFHSFFDNITIFKQTHIEEDGLTHWSAQNQFMLGN